MPYIATNYLTNPKAKLGTWVCTRTSSLGPYSEKPPIDVTGDPSYCGQCVSFATTVCPELPVGTKAWKKGELVKANTKVKAGTVIATFNEKGKYQGHVAVYHDQNDKALVVYDQWVTKSGKAIGRRELKFGAKGNSDNGSIFYVVE